MKLKIHVLLILCIACCSCAKLAHLQELLTLKDLSENKDSQEVYIETQTEKFEKLLQAVQEQTLSNYPDEQAIVKNFGKPILVRSVIENGVALKKWMYRYPAQSFGSPKVYLTFNPSGKLVVWQYLPRSEQQEASQINTQADDKSVEVENKASMSSKEGGKNE